MTPLPAQYRLRRAATLLHTGKVITHPTEAVWGLACVPWSQSAVARILQLKRRDPAKGMVLVADHISRFQGVIPLLPDDVQEMLMASWPGPNTWVVPDGGWAPEWIRGNHHSVAIRVSNHPLTVALCQAANTCLVSTSANPAGLEPARSQTAVQRYFRSAVDYYLPGRTGGLAQPTGIRDALTGQVLRGG